MRLVEDPESDRQTPAKVALYVVGIENVSIYDLSAFRGYAP
jgi:hypothetical protein